MEEIQEQVLRFRAEKRISRMTAFGLTIINELKIEQENQLWKLGESLLEIEEFLNQKHKIDIDLAHLAKHGVFLDEAKMKAIRKRFLDYGGELQREL